MFSFRGAKVSFVSLAMSVRQHFNQNGRRKKMDVPKVPFVRDRIRHIPPGFGWVDHRLVREHYAERCSHGALALYLFLAVVADGEGVSWWSERSLSSRLGMDIDRLRQARAELEAADLVAFSGGVWQVLQFREVV
jgi:hypothetical protein